MPADHLVALDCPTEEEISRQQYDVTIADPLRKIFNKRNGGMSMRRPMETNGCRRWRSISSHQGYAAQDPARCHTIPGDTRGDDGPSISNEASVDSELSTLGFFTKQISGAVANGYYASFFFRLLSVRPRRLLLVTHLADTAGKRGFVNNDYRCN